MNYRTLSDLRLTPGSRILVRLDLNYGADTLLPDSLKWAWATRTLTLLIERGYQLRVVTHLGRPTSAHDIRSTRFISDILYRQYQLPWSFIPYQPTPDIPADQPYQILENIRAWPEEYTQDEEFARLLMRDCQGFVHDAWGAAAHACTSLSHAPLVVPAPARAIGYTLQHELTQLTQSWALQSDQHYDLLLGGKKWAEKIEILARQPERLSTMYTAPLADTAQAQATIAGLVPHQVILKISELAHELFMLSLSKDTRRLTHLSPILITGLPLHGISDPHTSAWLTLLQQLVDSGRPVLIAGGDSSNFAYVHHLSGNNLILSTGGSSTLTLLTGQSLQTLEPFC